MKSEQAHKESSFTSAKKVPEETVCTRQCSELKEIKDHVFIKNQRPQFPYRKLSVSST